MKYQITMTFPLIVKYDLQADSFHQAEDAAIELLSKATFKAFYRNRETPLPDNCVDKEAGEILEIRLIGDEVTIPDGI
jgi:hypothetical protein